MPANIGNTLHEHTARMQPETDATPYATIGFARAPRYRRTGSLRQERNDRPAINIAGTTQASVWFRAYH